jgi:hypothetical protein
MARPAKSNPPLPLPSWLQPLMGIDVEILSPKELEDECVKRLKWLFSNYGVDNLSDLALRLIPEYCVWFFPVYRQEPETGGRPLDRERYFAREALVAIANEMKIVAAREGKSTRVGSKAAKAFHALLNSKQRKHIRGLSTEYLGPEIGTLQNWLNKPVAPPELVKQLNAREKIAAAIRKAALRLPK